MSEELLTIKELMDRWKVSKDFLYKRIREGGGVPYIRLDGEIRYRLSDVEKYEQENASA